MIYVPKVKVLKVNAGDIRTQIGGEFRIQRYDCMGNLNYDSGWNDNLITNFGMLACANDGNYTPYTSIGSVATPSSETNSSMWGWLASSNNTQSTVQVDGTAPNYEFSTLYTRRFNPGEGTGTIQEVGVGNQSDGTELFSHHTVSPAVTKAADETLDVSWRFTQWPMLIDVNSNSVDVGGTLYDTITRCLDLTSTGVSATGQFSASSSDAFWRCYDGNLGALDAATPLGNADNGQDGSANTTNNTATLNAGVGSRTFDRNWTLNFGILGAGIRTIRGITSTGIGFQTQFNGPPYTDDNDARIPKTTDDIMEHTWSMSWVRK